MGKNARRNRSEKNTLFALEADMKKARLISKIRENAELGDEEANKGRS